MVAGGVEASLRRLAHYDYWSDSVRRAIILDAKADLVVYGMGERPLLEIVARLAAGEPIQAIRDVRGTVYRLGAAEAYQPKRQRGKRNHSGPRLRFGLASATMTPSSCRVMKRSAPTRGRLPP